MFLTVGTYAYAAGDDAPTSWPIDKTAYTLLNPTPSDSLRQITPDRPDITEAPVTVDAGHYQAEFSYFEYDRNDDRAGRSDTLSILPANLKVGLLNNVDLQLLFEPYVNERDVSATQIERSQGFGDDTELRLKINFWGNDPPPQGTPDPWHGTAFGIMPFIKFPTGSGDLSNDHVEGGLIIPFSINLPHDFYVGTMAEFDVDYDDDTNGYGVDFVQTISIEHDIPGIKDLAGYLEYAGASPIRTGETYRATASFGLEYTVNPNLVIDCGGTAGLSRDADDYTVFVGTSIRI